ncbi:bifunctional DNA-formamidopyrimidine glycosylase/DNA-(apurinic or apyrimidinic site) lyase [Periweissella beninensis]|uniref:Formamidopyrimidine-DNA glycosylase n=1 Tax=Periweissella beninensis TaxID=504936 RepID=A0ABT0VI57_9LACO|nr:bifunctional DNA-formamidopyrimidine glycosylase/DNA-(apurinic or apyrimidinic site) lyase [Periweissella beninensis]MBM7544108.1 formamidopyrimidine-DNA glycosylase [Periweissella beninensis]MCM2437519.1 bifunctional DNA-formamidopyrimidine glycosylase/DNA-(apurinic or apyrimidinic site) lyase [Periweissella beninensis]MCT4396553.1 bifunctional DNA-formamidopyrimidine glycosylase/DNA-(apurinic or apyrimidinic site) lyase [Periweissella beninensis]
MPELPEVETVHRGLLRLVKNMTIESVETIWPKTLIADSPALRAKLAGKKIETIERRGKFLLFRLSDNLTLVSHLRMEGKYYTVPATTPLEKHVCVVFHLNHATDLWYIDTRKFGRMQVIETGLENELVPGIKKMGPEPTTTTLTFEYMQKIMSKSHKIIKPFLLDQANIAGLGNIYTDEVLWQTKIHPEQPVNTLSDLEIKQLRENIINELAIATEQHGTTVHSYTNAFGEAGSFQDQLDVYGRKGQPCKRCQTPLLKMKVAQRGTTYCPVCQVLH